MPLSPVISTVDAGLSATLRASIFTRSIGSDSPIIEEKLNGLAKILLDAAKFADGPAAFHGARQPPGDVAHLERLGDVVGRTGFIAATIVSASLWAVSITTGKSGSC